MKKITILLLHMQHGGIERQTVNLANFLSEKYEVEIISTYSMLLHPAYEVDERVKVRYLINDRPNRAEIKTAIKDKKPIELLKQGFKAIKLLYLKKHLMIKQIKSLNCDFVLSTRIEFAEMLSKYAPTGVVTITQEHLHNDSPHYIKRAQGAFKNLDYLAVLCGGSRDNFSKWLKDNRKIKIVEIPNILENIPESTAELNENRLVSAGRLHPVKNFGALIDIFALVKSEVPSAELTIVGGGEEETALTDKIKHLGLEKSVKITGMVSSEEVTRLMLSSDIYVMTSHTECFPMVLLEASAAGLPLVAFDVPVGPAAIINDGENGYLAEYGNNRQMADKIIYLLKNREALYATGKAARQSAYKYTKEKIMPLWYEIFDK